METIRSWLYCVKGAKFEDFLRYQSPQGHFEPYWHNQQEVSYYETQIATKLFRHQNQFIIVYLLKKHNNAQCIYYSASDKEFYT